MFKKPIPYLAASFIALTLVIANAEANNSPKLIEQVLGYANEVKIDPSELDKINAALHQTNLPIAINAAQKLEKVQTTLERVQQIKQKLGTASISTSQPKALQPTQSIMPKVVTTQSASKGIASLRQPINPSKPSLEDGGYSNLLYGETTQDSLLQFISSYNRKLSYPMAYEISSTIHQVALEHGLNPHFLMSVIAVESSFNPFAISKTGAMGLGQLKPATAQWLGVQDPFNPRQNVQGSAKYLRFLLDKYKGRADMAVAAYYKGQGTIDRQGLDDDARYYVSKVNKVWSQVSL